MGPTPLRLPGWWATTLTLPTSSRSSACSSSMTTICSQSWRCRPRGGSAPRPPPTSSSRLRAGTTRGPGLPNDSNFIGALSRRIEALQPDARDLVLTQLDDLPETIGLVSARLLVPVMAKLRVPRLNHLAAEAPATAVVVDGSLVVVTTSEPLTEACRRLGVELDVRPV